MNTPTPSQVTESYFYNTYPFLKLWISFVQNAFVNFMNYDATSCYQISQISNCTMKTIDYIQQNDSNAKVIRVMRILNDLHDSAWNGWTSFAAKSNNANGTRSLVTNQEVLQALSTLQSWDSALNNSPTFDPPTLLNIILGGVTT